LDDALRIGDAPTVAQARKKLAYLEQNPQEANSPVRPRASLAHGVSIAQDVGGEDDYFTGSVSLWLDAIKVTEELFTRRALNRGTGLLTVATPLIDTPLAQVDVGVAIREGIAGKAIQGFIHKVTNSEKLDWKADPALLTAHLEARFRAPIYSREDIYLGVGGKAVIQPGIQVYGELGLEAAAALSKSGDCVVAAQVYRRSGSWKGVLRHVYDDGWRYEVALRVRSLALKVESIPVVELGPGDPSRYMLWTIGVDIGSVSKEGRVR
jgi:hypothetical protein